MNLKFINSKEKRKIIEKLSEQFGITELPYLLVESGKEKTRGFSGHLSREEILKLTQTINVELLGLYLLKEENNEYRLGFDATNVFKDKISKNIIEIDEKMFNLWIRGNDLDIKKQKGSMIIKYKNDFYGCGKSNEEKIFNYVPKDRRLRK